MRDINRIEPFMNELTKIWKENCPDWRFGQFVNNVFGYIVQTKGDYFFFEEDEMLELIKGYFKK